MSEDLESMFPHLARSAYAITSPSTPEYNCIAWAAGDSSVKSFTVPIVDDGLVEANETVFVALTNPTGGATLGSPASATVTIVDNDVAQGSGQFRFSNPVYAVSENAGAVTIVVTRNDGSAGAATVRYSTYDRAGDPNVAWGLGDYIPTSGTLSFAPGVTSRTITVNVAGDTTIEPDEQFTVTILSPVNATLKNTSATGTVLSDELPPTLSIAAANASRNEGNSGPTPFEFTVTRTGDRSGAASVTYAVTGSGINSANATDFGGSFPSGTINFAAGEVSKTIVVNVTGDTTIEPDEGLTVTLSNVTGAALGTATATGTIVNDDASLSIAATSASKPEGNSDSTPFTFTVTRTGNLSTAASANFTITGSGDTAADASDFGGTLPTATRHPRTSTLKKQRNRH